MPKTKLEMQADLLGLLEAMNSDALRAGTTSDQIVKHLSHQSLSAHVRRMTRAREAGLIEYSSKAIGEPRLWRLTTTGRAVLNGV
jgi:hypothetical protein